MKNSKLGPHGIVVVDKPSGPTSHDVVAQARRVFQTRRVGHAGTLDPMATGVLVLLLGEATKLSDVATSENKTYLADVRFGRATDSQDADGQTLVEQALTPGWLGVDALERALDGERRREHQVPPAVSAIKVGGQRSYLLARRGEAPELEPRPVRVHGLRVHAFDDAHAELELEVSKGYYVRSLARDLAEALGVPAHLGGLRRVRSGAFGIEEACAWPPAAPPALLALRDVLPRLLACSRLTPTGVERARQGKVLAPTDFIDPPLPPPSEIPDSPSLCSRVMAWTDGAGDPVALGRFEGGMYRVQRGFAADSLATVGGEAARDCGKASLDGSRETPDAAPTSADQTETISLP